MVEIKLIYLILRAIKTFKTNVIYKNCQGLVGSKVFF